MRRTINVLWLDDAATEVGSGVEHLQDAFTEALKKQGYLCKYITVNDIAGAQKELSDNSKRIDFFVSDFKLDGHQTGITFLNSVRKSKRLKEHFILYSNNDTNRIRAEIINELKKNNDILESLNNYSFFSTANNVSKPSLINQFGKSIMMALSRWEELSALRGEYASANTLADSVLDKILTIIHSKKGTKNYCDRIDRLEQKIDDNTLSSSIDKSRLGIIFTSWHDCRKIRNSLEHNSEQWDPAKKDFFIMNSEDHSKIFEQNVSENRKKIIEESEAIKELLVDLVKNNASLSSLTTYQDYSNFINDK